MPTLSRQDRLVDLGTLALILVGLALCLVANDRLNDIAQLSSRHPGARAGSALAAADRARFLAYAGAGLVATGFIFGAAAAFRVARRRHASTS